MEKQYDEVQQNFWMPEKIGDFVCGIYEGIIEKVGENQSDVYKLRQENGELIFLWATAVLKTKMQLVYIGDDIKIVYNGEKKATRGTRTYKEFSVMKAQVSGVSGDISTPFFEE